MDGAESFSAWIARPNSVADLRRALPVLSDVLQLLDQLFVQLSLQVDVPFTGSLQMVDGVHHQLETVHVDVRSDPQPLGVLVEHRIDNVDERFARMQRMSAT